MIGGRPAIGPVPQGCLQGEEKIRQKIGLLCDPLHRGCPRRSVGAQGAQEGHGGTLAAGRAPVKEGPVKIGQAADHLAHRALSNG
jgi:hypothetical protein